MGKPCIERFGNLLSSAAVHVQLQCWSISGRQSWSYEIRDVGSASMIMLPADNDNRDFPTSKAPGPVIHTNNPRRARHWRINLNGTTSAIDHLSYWQHYLMLKSQEVSEDEQRCFGNTPVKKLKSPRCQRSWKPCPLLIFSALAFSDFKWLGPVQLSPVCSLSPGDQF